MLLNSVPSGFARTLQQQVTIAKRVLIISSRHSTLASIGIHSNLSIGNWKSRLRNASLPLLNLLFTDPARPWEGCHCSQSVVHRPHREMVCGKARYVLASFAGASDACLAGGDASPVHSMTQINNAHQQEWGFDRNASSSDAWKQARPRAHAARHSHSSGYGSSPRAHESSSAFEQQFGSMLEGLQAQLPASAWGLAKTVWVSVYGCFCMLCMLSCVSSLVLYVPCNTHRAMCTHTHSPSSHTRRWSLCS